MHRIIIYSLLLVFCFNTKLVAQQKDMYIKAGYLYDSKENKLLEHKVVHIKNNKIVSIGEFNSIPKNRIKDVVDLSEYTVLPGLLDAHTHVLFSQEADEDFANHSVHTLTMESDGLRTLRGSKRAQSYLDEGFTSIKDLGNSGLYLDVALRDAINEGTVKGPRIFASGTILAATGGQIYGVSPKHQDIIDLEYRVITSVDDAKNAVREHVNQNVDLIKICADNIPNNTKLTIDEMTEIVKTAHSYNLTVTAHCVTNQSAWNAIEAGVDGIEHGFNLSDSTLTRMAEKKIFLVPTENSKTYMETYAKLAGYSEDNIDWIDGYMEKQKNRLHRAIAADVIIVAGSDNYTDIGVTRGKSSKDMFLTYFEAGMKPLDILQSATYNSALQLNKEKEIGYLTPFANGDLIAVKGDLKNDFIHTLDQIVFVMKGGEIYLDITKTDK
ncbi:amidohydrolase family protein [Formosa sp. PL04]|uniref:metal-dependent hydrolase family protein n=1 Tax=Formosa sp. PL04 TaxID=3081755 RepID=UPI0029827957|nr:amidohydrolase family protein [Formosa sp. PL04]MDW5290563.1 amidohydrolase family protein [Formosa sp. PL04]